MNTADLQAFNDGFDYAVKMITEANEKGYQHYMLVDLARGFRYDKWWREGTETAIAWALRNGKTEKIGTYRDSAK